MDTWLRLVWALPLVLLVGLTAALLLKRFGAPGVPPTGARPRIHLEGTLALSDDTRLHWVRLDQQAYLVLESTRQAQLLRASPGATPAEPVPARRAWPWRQQPLQGSRP